MFFFNMRAFTRSLARAQMCSDQIGICYQSAPSVQNRSIYFCSLAKSDATHLWNWCPLTLHEGYRERQKEQVFFVLLVYVWYNGASLRKPIILVWLRDVY